MAAKLKLSEGSGRYTLHVAGTKIALPLAAEKRVHLNGSSVGDGLARGVGDGVGEGDRVGAGATVTTGAMTGGGVGAGVGVGGIVGGEVQRTVAAGVRGDAGVGVDAIGDGRTVGSRDISGADASTPATDVHATDTTTPRRAPREGPTGSAYGRGLR